MCSFHCGHIFQFQLENMPTSRVAAAILLMLMLPTILLSATCILSSVFTTTNQQAGQQPTRGLLSDPKVPGLNLADALFGFLVAGVAITKLAVGYF